MLDQLKIGTKSSYDDFGASLAERAISAPSKKEIKETVPFSNLTYDFSKINGELYWEERELKCVFEIIAESPEELERKKTAFSGWVMNVMNEDIHDPYVPDFHYYGTFSEMDFADEDCVEKTTATVTFKAYPYKIANERTVYEFSVPAGQTKTVSLENDSAHRLAPIVKTDYALTITKDGSSYVFSAGTSSDKIFTLAVGENTMEVYNAGAEETNVEVYFYREVF